MGSRRCPWRRVCTLTCLCTRSRRAGQRWTDAAARPRTGDYSEGQGGLERAGWQEKEGETGGGAAPRAAATEERAAWHRGCVGQPARPLRQEHEHGSERRHHRGAAARFHQGRGASTYDARLASEEAIPASWTAWSMPDGTSVAVTVTSVPSPAAARCQVIVMVPANDGSSASNTARCTTRSGGTSSTNPTSTTSVAPEVLPVLSAASR